ncbi:MAG TPA: hypothetical protein VGI46_15970 [Candidatus Acidoferrum sp.]
MIVVADASPLNYAVRIGVADVLFELYGLIIIPTAVKVELTTERAPAVVRSWIANHGDRIDVREVVLPEDQRLSALDAGEAQAIFLAETTPKSLLIIDEREGRAEARRRGLAVTGLLGVIRDGAVRGYIDFEGALRKLKATDFRLSDEVEEIIRAQYNNRRSGK